MKRFLHRLGLVAGFLMMLSGAAFAQQEAMFSQYMFNGLVLNPAYAGSTGALSAAALYRNQWADIEGAPVTQTLSVHAPLHSDQVGLGLSITNDKIGVTNTFSMNGSYAFRIKTRSGVFAMGLQAGFTKLYADYSTVELNPHDNPDARFNDVQNYLMFNFGNGFYYHTDRFYAGISAPNLFRAKMVDWGGDESSESSLSRHYFLNTGYVFTLNHNVKVKPSTIVKVAEGAPIQFDINTNVWLHDFIGLGGSYRSNNSLIGLVELQVSKQLRVGYAYDHPISNLSRYSGNTHEVMLRFDLLPDGQHFVSPRLF